MRGCHVTYEIITPESAEHGDAEERGFVLADGSHVELPGDVYGAPAGEIKARCALSLRDALQQIGLVEDSGFWFSEVDGRKHYGTGAETRHSLHLPDGASAASYDRVRRILKAENALI